MPCRTTHLKPVEWRRPVTKPNWLELPAEITAKILHKLGAIEILDSAQKVCTTWHKICKDPTMWRVIDMHGSEFWYDMPYDAKKLFKNAINRSQGQLVDISIEYFVDDELMEYMADGSPQLRRLQVAHWECWADSWTDFIFKFPLLEELSLTSTRISAKAIVDAAQECPNISSIKYISKCYDAHTIQGFANLIVNYAEVIALAKSMTQMRHLHLVGYAITKRCLKTILDGCPELESLDMQGCFSIKLDGNIKQRCIKQIKDLKLPGDSNNFSKKDKDRLARLDDRFYKEIDTTNPSSPQLLKAANRVRRFLPCDMKKDDERIFLKLLAEDYGILTR